MSKYDKAFANFGKLFFYMVVFLHSIGCFWYKTLLENKDKFEELENGERISLQWYPPTEWMDFSKSKLFTDELSPG